jgi:hypothetical protein
MWEVIITVVLKLIDLFISDDEAKKKAKSRFLKFVEARTGAHKRPVAGKEAYQKAKKELTAKKSKKKKKKKKKKKVS